MVRSPTIKAEASVAELMRARLFCDEWDQASHSGDIARGAESHQIKRSDVTQLGDVLTGTSAGRESADQITIFDSTGLAIQDLAIAIAALARADELATQSLTL